MTRRKDRCRCDGFLSSVGATHLRQRTRFPRSGRVHRAPSTIRTGSLARASPDPRSTGQTAGSFRRSCLDIIVHQFEMSALQIGRLGELDISKDSTIPTSSRPADHASPTQHRAVLQKVHPSLTLPVKTNKAASPCFALLRSSSHLSGLPAGEEEWSDADSVPWNRFGGFGGCRDRWVPGPSCGVLA